MAKHRLPRRRRWGLAVLVLLAAVFFLRWSNTALQVTRFAPVFRDLPAGFDGCRAAVIGDLLDRYRPVPEGYAASAAEALSAIAPTYYVTGNHEWALGNVPALKQTLADHGVTVLSNQFTALERGGDTIVLAGIDDPNGYADQKTPEQLAAEVYAQWGDPFWVLLAHRNDRFASRYSLLGADLVVSGHAHGGIIRLPFTDGLISHDFQLFPSYTAGLYRENGSALFVTRGLGNSGPSFRLFNRPEVAILTLHKES